MHTHTPDFRSPLSYSVQNEDYRTELATLDQFDQKKRLRILMVASSGENALSILAARSLAEIWAVDLNPAQVHLNALRVAGCQTLTRDEQLKLFGTVDGDPLERVALYDKTRTTLSQEPRDFWDERRDLDIAFGLHHVGRNDCLMRDLQEELDRAGFHPLGEKLEDDMLSRWKAVYATVMTPERIRDRFGLPSEALARRISDISDLLAETHFRALQSTEASANPYLTTVFAGTYAFGESGLPLYLQLTGQESLRRNGIDNRLNLATGNIMALAPGLAADCGGFDLISLSNIADWMDEPQFDSVVRSMCTCLREGGYLLARTATGSTMILDVLRRHLEIDEALLSRLSKTERGPWFRTIAAGRRK